MRCCMRVAAHMLLSAVQMCVVVNTCCILAAVLLQVKAGLTMSQRCNVEVGSLSIRSKHLQLICTAGCWRLAGVCQLCSPYSKYYRREFLYYRYVV